MWGWLVHQRVILALILLVPISTPGWRGTVRVKCLTQEHNTMSLALGLELRLLDQEFSALHMRPLFVNNKKMEC